MTPPPPAWQVWGAVQSVFTVHTGLPPMHVVPIWHVPPIFEQQIWPAAHGVVPLGAEHGGIWQVMRPPPPPGKQTRGATQSSGLAVQI